VTGSPDALTVVYASQTLAKAVQVIDGVVTRVDDPWWPKLVRFETLEVIHPPHLLSVLEALASEDPAPCIVRADPLAETGRRALYDSPGGPAGLRVMPRRWIGYDIEKVPAAGIDPLNQPVSVVAKARQCLPPEHHDVSAVFQITASAGKRLGELRLRLWFLLDRPMLGKQVAAWCKPGIDSGWLDPCTLKNEVLPHFIAVRIVGNSPDPCPMRWGLIPGARDRVPVPDRTLALPERRRKTSATSATLAAGAPENREAKLRARYGSELNLRRRGVVKVIRHEIEAVRDAGIGARHPAYLAAAARIYGFCRYWAIPLDQPRALLEEAYLETLTPEEAHRREHGSIKGVWNWLERRQACQ
jgi:hypothetical protein